MAASRRPPRNRSVATPPFRRAIEQTGAPERDVRLADVDFQLASRAPRAFTRSGWWFELKYDGYRILAERRGKQSASATEAEVTPPSSFPRSSSRSAPCRPTHFILDGEVVVEDSEGRPSFSLLQQRAQRARPPPGASPATYWTFDLLAAEGRDLRGLSLARRRELLRGLTADGGRVRCVEPVETEGDAFYEAVKQMGLEGIVAKRSDGAHHAGRGTDWQKVVTHQVGDFAVVGHTAELTSLALATRDGSNSSTPAGWAAGSGPGRRHGSSASSPSTGARRRPAGTPRGTATSSGSIRRWSPRFATRSRERGGSPRAPVFCRFRDDRRPDQCLPPWRSEERTVNFVNLEKVWFPEDGLTKGDLIRYYQAISPWMLPYLRDRPLMLTRFPDGIHGESFFQKQAGGPYVPSWVHTVEMEGDEGPIRQFVCEDAETLAFLVNLGTIPFHLWSARVADSRAPRLVHPRPRPEERALRARHHPRHRRACAVRGAGAAALHQDQRQLGPARARSAGATAGPRGRHQLRAGARRGAGPAAPRHRHHRARGPCPAVEGLRGLSPERPGKAPRRPVLGTAAPRRSGLDAAPLGRGGARAPPAPVHRARCSGADGAPRSGPVPGRARRGTGAGDRARAAPEVSREARWSLGSGRRPYPDRPLGRSPEGRATASARRRRGGEGRPGQ